MGGKGKSESAGGSSFYYSFLLLPPARREAITAVYGYMRVVDDAVDEAHSLPLEYWRAELDRVYSGVPEHPIGQRLREAVERFGLRREYFEELLQGCEMDGEVSRFEDFEALTRYCRLVASAVGRVCLPIFGADPELSNEYADRLGLALQMVNILRDVGEDADRGRIYLPLEDLRGFEVSEEDLTAHRESENFKRLMRYEGERAFKLFEEARSALPTQRAERRALLAPEVMREIYYALLLEMRRAEYPALRARVSLSRWRKVRIAARTWLRSRFGFHPGRPSRTAALVR